MNQLPDDFLRTLKDHDRRLNDMERAPRATSIQTSNTAYTIFSLPAGQTIWVWFTLSSVAGALPINTMGVPRWDIYRNASLSPNPHVAANLWPYGSEWTSTEIMNLDIIPNFPKSYSVNSPNDAVLGLLLRNRGGTALNNLAMYLDWKLPLLQGGGS